MVERKYKKTTAEVLKQLAAEGLTTKQIAERTHTSQYAVKAACQLLGISTMAARIGSAPKTFTNKGAENARKSYALMLHGYTMEEIGGAFGVSALAITQRLKRYNYPTSLREATIKRLGKKRMALPDKSPKVDKQKIAELPQIENHYPPEVKELIQKYFEAHHQ